METVKELQTERPQFTELILEDVDVQGRAATLRATYWFLSISIAGAVAGGLFGMRSEAIIDFFSSIFGWIVALVLLNVVPMIALRMVTRPAWGVFVLALDGFISGVVISPLLFVAAATAPQLIWMAVGVTAAVFLAVTFYVMTTRKMYSAPRATMTGAFLSIAAGVVLNHYLDLGLVGILISIAIAVFGVIVLVSNTSRVLRDPMNTGAIPGALLLFAGLFNVFLGVLNILLRILGGGRRRG